MDAITSSGYIEGWAFNASDILAPLGVLVSRDRNEVARGIANIFREDLMNSGCGTGWCGFRIRTSVPPSMLRDQPLTLADAQSGTVLQQDRPLRFAEDSDPALLSISQVIITDPTLLASVDQLKGCQQVFIQFIKHRGVEEFVRAAYVFILSRPADAEGVANYAKLIRLSLLDPLELLQILCASDEFRSRPRTLSAPSSPAFPFRLS